MSRTNCPTVTSSYLSVYPVIEIYSCGSFSLSSGHARPSSYNRTEAVQTTRPLFFSFSRTKFQMWNPNNIPRGRIDDHSTGLMAGRDSSSCWECNTEPNEPLAWRRVDKTFESGEKGRPEKHASAKTQLSVSTVNRLAQDLCIYRVHLWEQCYTGQQRLCTSNTDGVLRVLLGKAWETTQSLN